MTDAPKLSPSALRIMTFYVAFFAAIAAPVVVGLLLLMLGPQPYLLVPQGLSAQVLGSHDGPV